MFNARRVRATRKGKPGEEIWAIWHRNLDGSEPRYYLSNAPQDTPLETLAYVGGSSGALKRSSRLKRATWVWANTRPVAGLAGIIT